MIIDLTQDDEGGIDNFAFSNTRNNYLHVEVHQVQLASVVPPLVIDLTGDDSKDGIYLFFC